MSTATLLPTAVEPISNLDPEAFYEIHDGAYVELPPMSVFSAWVIGQLSGFLNRFATEHGLGYVVPEMLFDFGPAFRHNRRPDVAFVSFDRWPRDRRISRARAWAVVPDLVVEVVSPNDPAEDLIDKLDEYFRAGVRCAWVVYPSQSLIHVYESLTTVRGFGPDDEVEGAPALPGFRLKAAELFGVGMEPDEGDGP